MSQRVLLLLFITLFASRLSAQVCFPVVQSLVPFIGRGYAPADVNGDGYADIVIFAKAVNGPTSYDAISSYLNNKDGSMSTSPIQTKISAQGIKPAAGDFNGDNKIDIVTIESTGGKLSVYYGNGDGTFKLDSTYAGLNPIGLTIADFNADGRVDIAFANAAYNRFTVQYTSISHRQDSIVSYNMSFRPFNLANGDVNNDGYPDLVLVGDGSVMSPDSIVSFLSSKSAGFKQGGPAALTTWAAEYLSLGDINGDGKLDIATNAEPYSSTTPHYHFGDGKGKFGPMTEFHQTSEFDPIGGDLRILNLDGDKYDDVIVGNYVYLNKGYFTTPYAIHVPTRVPYQMVLADFNNDGLTDIAFPPQRLNFPIMLNRGDGYLNAGLEVPFLTSGTNGSPVFDDYNNDGKTDMMLWKGGNELSMALTTDTAGRFTFSDSTLKGFSGKPSPIFLMDFTGSGKKDLLSYDGTKISYHTNTGPGEYAYTVGFGYSNLAGIVTGNFNNDNRIDFAATASGSRIDIFTSDGTSKLYTKSTIFPLVAVMASADINGDKLDDIITSSGNSQVTVYYTKSSGLPTSTNYTVGGTINKLRTGDLNQDGKQDIITLNTSDSSISILLNTGTSFAKAVKYKFTAKAVTMLITDLDKDTYPDIVVTLQNNKLAVLYGKGDGSFKPASYLAAWGSTVLGAEDLNNDGYPEIFGGEAKIFIFPNNGGVLSDAIIFGEGEQYVQNMQVADVIPDGKPDLVITTSGTVYILANMSALLPSFPDTVCTNTPIDAGVGYQYKWSTGEKTRTIYPSMSRKYSVTITNANGCQTTSKSIQVNVKPGPKKPVIQVYGDTMICNTDSVLIGYTKTAGLTYTWIEDGKPTTRQDTFVKVGKAGRYQVKVDAPNGCSDLSKPVEFTYSPALNPKITASALTSCGGSIKLKASYNGSKPDWFYWIHNTDTAITSYDSFYANQSGYYKVVLKRGFCNAASDSIGLTVYEKPVAKLNAKGNVFTCKTNDSLVLISMNNYHGAGYMYNWTKDGKPTGGNDTFLVIKTPGKYTLRIDNPNCQGQGADTVVHSFYASPVATITPTDTIAICQGGYTKLKATADSGVTYAWYHGSVLVGSGQTFVANDSGSYTLKATNKNGCTSTSAPTVVKVNPFAPAKITVFGNNPVCEGLKVALKAPAGSHFIYTWIKDGTVLSFKDSVLLAGAAGTYKLVLSTKAGCTDTSEVVKVMVYPKPVGTLSFDGKNKLKVTADTVYTYTWYKDSAEINGVTDTVHTISANGKYKVKMTSSDGCAEFTNELNVTTFSGMKEALHSIAKLSVYPNPAQAGFTIRYTSPQYGKMIIGITDCVGRQITLERVKTGFETTHYLNAYLKPGLYNITVFDGAYYSTAQLIVVSK